MSKRYSVVIASCRSSSAVNRSTSKVARLARCRTSATKRFRGLWRLLPLPWAKITAPTCRWRNRQRAFDDAGGGVDPHEIFEAGADSPSSALRLGMSAGRLSVHGEILQLNDADSSLAGRGCRRVRACIEQGLDGCIGCLSKIFVPAADRAEVPRAKRQTTSSALGCEARRMSSAAPTGTATTMRFGCWLPDRLRQRPASSSRWRARRRRGSRSDPRSWARGVHDGRPVAVDRVQAVRAARRGR